jgi:hypothetical protein
MRWYLGVPRRRIAALECAGNALLIRDRVSPLNNTVPGLEYCPTPREYRYSSVVDSIGQFRLALYSRQRVGL